jgi:hypothetical protein
MKISSLVADRSDPREVFLTAVQQREGLRQNFMPPDFLLAAQGVIMPRFVAVPEGFATGL